MTIDKFPDQVISFFVCAPSVRIADCKCASSVRIVDYKYQEQQLSHQLPSDNL